MREVGNQTWCILLHWEKSNEVGKKFQLRDTESRSTMSLFRWRRSSSSSSISRSAIRTSSSSLSASWNVIVLSSSVGLAAWRGEILHSKRFQDNVKQGKVLKGWKILSEQGKYRALWHVNSLYTQLYTHHTVYGCKYTFTKLIWSINRALGLPHACFMRAKISGGSRFLRFFFRTRKTAFCLLSFSSLIYCSTKSSHA